MTPCCGSSTGSSEYDIRRPMVPTGHEPARTRQARGERRGRLSRRHVRPAVRRAVPVVRRRCRAERRHVGDGRRVTRADRRAVPPGVGPLGRNRCVLGARRDRPRAVVARRAQRGDAAPHPAAHDRRDRSSCRPGRHRPRADRRRRRPARSTTTTCRRATRRGGRTTGAGWSRRHGAPRPRSLDGQRGGDARSVCATANRSARSVQRRRVRHRHHAARPRADGARRLRVRPARRLSRSVALVSGIPGQLLDHRSGVARPLRHHRVHRACRRRAPAPQSAAADGRLLPPVPHETARRVHQR